MRVVPNLYPAFERQEVVVHSSEHVRSFADLDDDHVTAVWEAWSRRIDAETAPVLALINEGRLAGASLPHSHSQLVWTELPPEDADELRRLLDPYPVAERNGAVAAVHPVGAGPYESLIAPASGTSEPADLLILLRDVVLRLHAAEGRRPWNAWLHLDAIPHLHFLPRLTALAGVELGAGVYVNVVPPERAAERLRG